VSTTEGTGTGLKVAVTGATGEIGRPFVRILEKTPGVGSIVAMARRPFVPSEHGWMRTEFVQGDVTNRDDVAEFVDGADVVVHLAFLILGDRNSTRKINLEGSRNVFDAAVSARCRRIVYTSSIAAYGFSAGHPPRLTEETPPAGTEHFYYSAQKAELEEALKDAVAGTLTETFIFRPPFVGGPDAHALLLILPQVQLAPKLPTLPLAEPVAGLTRVLPDFGVPLQIVHVYDVAQALCAGVVARGQPGVYNIAAPGELTMTDIARALGWRVMRLPQAVAHGVAELQRRLPAAPAISDWVQTLTVPVIMSTDKAERKLGWRATRDAETTLRETVKSARASGLPGVG
jgi:UDP-glucose 4-epimerase